MADVDEILREKAARKAHGGSRSAFWEHIKLGLFPAPVRIGPKSVGWFASEIAAHQAKLKAKRDGQ
ncbi:MAG TPA: AlpA family phage regulatory protein [Methyloceanibacter sp.]|jgi:prophage regulatory protein|nr:AlpA family phage regulatory protein [Methyloceanibacter sp.]